MKKSHRMIHSSGMRGPSAGPWLRGLRPTVECPWGEIVMTVEPGTSFAVLLRRLRKSAFLTQEDLAQAARLSSRAISDLERGLTRTTRKETARRLADALKLTGSLREDFVTAALGRSPVSESSPVACDDVIRGQRPLQRRSA